MKVDGVKLSGHFGDDGISRLWRQPCANVRARL